MIKKSAILVHAMLNVRKLSFYALVWNDRGHIVFVLSVCLSVVYLTFAITFELLEIGTSYLACIQ